LYAKASEYAKRPNRSQRNSKNGKPRAIASNPKDAKAKDAQVTLGTGDISVK
jgi:hypothetical protein